MDFQYRPPQYTPELEQFRAEVRAWIDEHLPPDRKSCLDVDDMPEDLYQFGRELRRKLGDKGWLYPAHPKAYGGGGLTRQHAAIINDELVKRDAPIFPNGQTPIFSGSIQVIPGLLVWGTEEQKKRFLPGILTGRTTTFQATTEPQGGSDAAGVKARAVKDGDDWLITGQKIFVSGRPGTCDYLWGPFLTDPNAPRHRNLGFFVIPAQTPGVTLIPMRLLNGNNQHLVIFENARVPGDQLIGGDHQGWQVQQTCLENEHGGSGGDGPPRSAMSEEVEDLFRYVRAPRNGDGEVLGSDPLVRERAIDFYIDHHVGSLLGMRNYSMSRKKQQITYQGSQGVLWRKEKNLLNSDRMREVMGPYANLHEKDPQAPNSGKPFYFQRQSLVMVHPGGTCEVLKLIIARRTGLSRTQEAPAPLPPAPG